MLIGAHYYAWYKNNNWQQKTIRGHLQQLPITQFENNWYRNSLSFPISDSNSLATVRQHFEWCKQYGIDFLFVSCNKEELLPYLDLAEEIGIKLSVHIETLGVTQEKKVEKGAVGKLVFHATRVKEWFNHPAWFHIEGKPVVAYYVTRQISDDCIEDAIAKLRKVFGPVHIFGDEVWWQTPKPNRLKLFDTIFAYNMYINKDQKMDKGKVVNPGAVGEAYLEMIAPYEKAYFENARALGVRFAPTVLPGYNDRAVRYDSDHYILPREKGLFLSQYLDYAKQYLAEDSVLLITSFNEWYEDSQIEPVLEAFPEYKAFQTDLNLFCETNFEPYGLSYLETIRSFKQAFKPVVLEPLVPKTEPIEQVTNESPQNVFGSDKKLLDSCALLYYHTTVLPILETDRLLKQDIQKKYYTHAEEAHKRGFSAKQIKVRAKELAHFFKVNQDSLIRETLK